MGRAADRPSVAASEVRCICRLGATATTRLPLAPAEIPVFATLPLWATDTAALGLAAFLLTESFLAACADTACKLTTAMTETNKRPINEECVAMLLLSVDGRTKNAEYTTWQKQ